MGEFDAWGRNFKILTKNQQIIIRKIREIMSENDKNQTFKSTILFETIWKSISFLNIFEKIPKGRKLRHNVLA